VVDAGGDPPDGGCPPEEDGHHDCAAAGPEEGAGARRARARGLHEAAKALKRTTALLAVLAGRDGDQEDYKKLVEALCVGARRGDLIQDSPPPPPTPTRFGPQLPPDSFVVGCHVIFLV